MELPARAASDLDAICLRLRRRNFGSDTDALARCAATLVQAIVNDVHVDDRTCVSSIVTMIRYVGDAMESADALAFVAQGVVDRAVALIAEECARVSGAVAAPARSDSDAAVPIDSVEGSIRPVDAATAAIRGARAAASAIMADAQVDKTPSAFPNAFGVLPYSRIRAGVCDAIVELLAELDASSTSIVSAAAPLLQPGDVVMTHGFSRTAVAVIASAAKRAGAPLEVIITEAAPWLSGHTAGKALVRSSESSRAIIRTVVTDSAVEALMPRVSKVILGATALSSDGAAVCLAGSLGIALAAAAHGVPVCIVANVLKLRPRIDASIMGLALGSPSDVLPASLNDVADNEALVGLSYTLDTVPPRLIHAIVTNTHVVSPGQAAWLLRETYGDCGIAVQV